MSALRRLLDWCRKPGKTVTTGFTRSVFPLYALMRAPGALVCLSALLSVLGTYLIAVRVPVWIGDSYGYGEYEPMHAYMPLGFALWLIALVFFIGAVISRTRRRALFVPSRTVFSVPSLIAAIILGSLAFASAALPWVVTERAVTSIETRGGTFNVPQFYALSGFSLMREIGEIALVLVGGIISLLVPFAGFFESKRPDAVRAFLFLLSSICVIGPVALLYSSIQGGLPWGISFGQLGLMTYFKSLELGFFIAAFSSLALLVSGLITTARLARSFVASDISH